MQFVHEYFDFNFRVHYSLPAFRYEKPTSSKSVEKTIAGEKYSAILSFLSFLIKIPTTLLKYEYRD